MRIIASQKIGMLIPVSARTEVNLSSHEYCLTAEITPTGTPTSDRDEHGEGRELQRGREARQELRGYRPPRDDGVAEVPCERVARNIPYWTMTGLSSPMLARSCCTCSWVACWPRRICAGSPGMARTMKNTTMDTPSKHRDDLQDPAPDKLGQSL